ncbi:MAG: 2-oxo acid dehydrogenase subunit E2 [Verrucomicrobiales bacterium]|nr:2-oxo acid dehydrogenase subunit E2 [Verrucomicrobiales bacterium]
MNIEVGTPEPLTSYRKIAIASWRHPRDPSTYSWVDLPVGAVEEFLAKVGGEIKPTLTHFVALVMADCVRRQSDFNRFLRAGKLYPRLSTDAFITTLIRDKKGKDLSGFVLRDILSMPIAEVAKRSAEEADKLKRGEDPEMDSVRRRVEFLPSFLLKPIFAVQEFFAYRLNLNPTWIGMPKDRFGSFMVSNIGALGLERGLIPLSPYTRCPIIIGIGKPREAPVVRDGEVCVERVVTISLTFDHRYADGAQGALVMRRFEKIFANPEGFPDVFSGGQEE